MEGLKIGMVVGLRIGDCFKLSAVLPKGSIALGLMEGVKVGTSFSLVVNERSQLGAVLR